MNGSKLFITKPNGCLNGLILNKEIQKRIKEKMNKFKKVSKTNIQNNYYRKSTRNNKKMINQMSIKKSLRYLNSFATKKNNIYKINHKYNFLIFYTNELIEILKDIKKNKNSLDIKLLINNIKNIKNNNFINQIVLFLNNNINNSQKLKFENFTRHQILEIIQVLNEFLLNSKKTRYWEELGIKLNKMKLNLNNRINNNISFRNKSQILHKITTINNKKFLVENIRNKYINNDKFLKNYIFNSFDMKKNDYHNNFKKLFEVDKNYIFIQEKIEKMNKFFN